MNVRLRIYGKVQGVWFRGWLVDEASARGVDGWVRNRSDGTVEAVLHGDAPAVRSVVDRCHAGPSAARVERIETFEVDEVPAPGFVQLATV